MKKRYIFLLLLLIIAGGIYFFAPSLESIVKAAVHKYGSAVTGTDVNLQGFNLKLADGEGRINKITVANPKNYKTKNIFELEEIMVKVDLKSLTSDTIIIEQISINKPVIAYEILSLTQNNISELLNNIKKNTASAVKEEKADTAKPAETADKGTKEAGKKVIIKKLSVKNGEIKAVAGVAADIANATVNLPEITLTNIGEDKGGASVAETISKVLTKILNTASQTVIDSKISDLKGVAEKNLNNVVGGVKDRVKEFGIFGK